MLAVDKGSLLIVQLGGEAAVKPRCKIHITDVVVDPRRIAARRLRMLGIIQAGKHISLLSAIPRSEGRGAPPTQARPARILILYAKIREVKRQRVVVDRRPKFFIIQLRRNFIAVEKSVLLHGEQHPHRSQRRHAGRDDAALRPARTGFHRRIGEKHRSKRRDPAQDRGKVKPPRTAAAGSQQSSHQNAEKCQQQRRALQYLEPRARLCRQKAVFLSRRARRLPIPAVIADKVSPADQRDNRRNT